MKRILIYIVVLAAVLILPVDGSDVGKLRPVQAVSLYVEDGQVVLETDTQDRGVGTDPTAALENLKATTPAIVYLDTAEYLLVSEDAISFVDDLRGILKESVKLCLAEGKVVPEDAARYLSVHGDLPKLKNWIQGQELPVLALRNERMILQKKGENGN